jgi:O-antigen ligase
MVAAMIFLQLLALGAVDGVPAAFFALCEIVTCAATVALVNTPLSGRFWREAGPVMLVFLGALVWAALPLLATTASFLPRPPILAPDAAQLELLKLAGVGAVCLTGALIGLSRSRLQYLIVDIALAGLAYTLLALWVGQASPMAVWGQSKGAHAFRFTGTLLNANAAGCVFGMIGLVSLGLLQSLLKRTSLRDAGLSGLLRLALVACAVIAAFGACVLTQSRTGLALAAIFGVVVVWSEARRRARRGAANVVGNSLMAAAAAGLLLLGLALGASQFSSRWGSLLADAQVRGEAYMQYFGAIGRSPWFGYGLGGFRALHESILTPSLATAMWDFGAAHSAVTQAALEGGLPFILMLVVAAGMIVKRISGGDRRRAGSAMVTGVLAAAGLALAFSFVDIALNVPAIAAFCALLLGLAWGDRFARDAPRPVRIAGRTESVSKTRVSVPDWTRP